MQLIIQAKPNLQDPTKILLLGTGNSGKSTPTLLATLTHAGTFCKQLTSEYGGSNPHFQMTPVEVVNSLKDNAVTGLLKLIDATQNRSAKATIVS